MPIQWLPIPSWASEYSPKYHWSVVPIHNSDKWGILDNQLQQLIAEGTEQECRKESGDYESYNEDQHFINNSDDPLGEIIEQLDMRINKLKG